MRAALALARRGLGNVWPNPAVGCLIVRDGHVVGRGWTQPGGRPHAETEALRRAGNLAAGATVYVTLEPCAHHGKTPPCAEALIAAGVSRVVTASGDPDPRVDGRGLAMLRTGGVAVTDGVCVDHAAHLNAGFMSRLHSDRPMVTLKAATSLDGRIATASGDSQWITGERARMRGHLLRATHDAILVGRGTVQQDNPRLTCRLPGLGVRSPVRVILDSSGRTVVAASKLVEDGATSPVWVMTRSGSDIAGPLPSGIETIAVAEAGCRGLDIAAVLHTLANRGITRLLVEGGGGIATSFLRAGFVDRLLWFRAPIVIGDDGLALFEGMGIDALADAANLQFRGWEKIGQDVLETYERQT